MFNTRATGSGLVLQELGMDGAAVQAALKQMDDRFALWPPDGMSPYWRVVYHVSDWQESRVVCTWMDADGNPLPLSSGLLTEVDKLRLDGRNTEPDADEFNRLREERIDREKAKRGQAIIDDHEAKVMRGRTSVSFGPLTRLSEMPRRQKPKAS